MVSIYDESIFVKKTTTKYTLFECLLCNSCCCAKVMKKSFNDGDFLDCKNDSISVDRVNIWFFYDWWLMMVRFCWFFLCVLCVMFSMVFVGCTTHIPPADFSLDQAHETLVDRYYQSVLFDTWSFDYRLHLGWQSETVLSSLLFSWQLTNSSQPSMQWVIDLSVRETRASLRDELDLFLQYQTLFSGNTIYSLIDTGMINRGSWHYQSLVLQSFLDKQQWVWFMIDDQYQPKRLSSSVRRDWFEVYRSMITTYLSWWNLTNQYSLIQQWNRYHYFSGWYIMWSSLDDVAVYFDSVLVWWLPDETMIMFVLWNNHWSITMTSANKKSVLSRSQRDWWIHEYDITLSYSVGRVTLLSFSGLIQHEPTYARYQVDGMVNVAIGYIIPHLRWQSLELSVQWHVILLPELKKVPIVTDEISVHKMLFEFSRAFSWFIVE